MHPARFLSAVAAAALSATALVLVPSVAAQASTSGTVGRIVFDASLPSGKDAIFTVNPDGSGLTQLTSGNDTDLGPDVSADGTRITYSSDHTGHAEVWVMNADGSDQHQLTSDASTDWYPAWSPDGSTIVFRSDQTGDGDLYSIPSDSTPSVPRAETRLTDTPGLDSVPEYSPDGSKILFHTTRLNTSPTSCGSSCDQAVYVMDADGTNQHQVAGGDGERDRFPNWSPDGSRIVYQHNATAGPADSDGVYVANADGTGAAKVAGTDTDDQGPDFSPDGSTISYDRGGNVLLTVPVAGGPTRVIVNSVDPLATDWSVIPVSTPASSAPAVTHLGPSNGPTAGGTTVTIAGSHFLGTSAVRFGNVDATSFTVDSDVQLTATSPAGSGTPHVTVVNATGTSPTGDSDVFTYDTPAAAPAISSMSPTSGPLGGGTVVTVTGSGFTGTTGVTVGGAAATSFAVSDDTSMTVTTPPTATPGDAAVVVTNPQGSNATSPGATFRYRNAPRVTALSPSSGPASGGTSVKITGTGFAPASGVSFGGSPAQSYMVTSSTSITAVAPRGAVGAVDVTVSSPYGTSPTGSTDRFTYRPTLQAAVLQPNGTTNPTLAGPSVGGTSLAIYTTRAAANSLSSVTRIRVAGASVPFTLVTGSKALNGAQLQIVLPPHVAGTVPIVVDGPGWSSPPFTFTYSGPAPHLQLVRKAPNGTYSPATGGPAAGGTVVDVIGDPRAVPALATATAVTVGGVGVPFSYVSGTGTDNGGQLTLRMPTHRVGTVNVVVQEPGWTSPPITYTYR